jgi:6-phosphogluconolactonase
MKYFVLLNLIVVLVSCKMEKKEQSKLDIVSAYFYVGTYTHGASEGMYKYALNADGTLDSVSLVAKTENPSFLALTHDKKFLIAGNEIKKENGEGTVESYAVESNGLKFLSRTNSGGAHTCHVQVNDHGLVIAANYTGGNVGLLKLDSLGKLSQLLEVKQHVGKGTTDRQESPHAHSAWFTQDGTEVIAVDLGTNELWFYDMVDGRLIAKEQQRLAMADGAGPRHLTFHPNGKSIYVLNELNGTISTVIKNAEGIYETTNTVTTLPDNFKEFNKCADIHITNNGKFVYATNRGHNSIAIFLVDDKDVLHLVGFEPTKGEEPRNFKLSPDEKFLLVANQNSDNIISFKRDIETGLLTFVNEINAPAPVCILFE